MTPILRTLSVVLLVAAFGTSVLAQELGLDADWFASPDALQALSGNRVLPGSRPLASVYSGHQFGVWAGQLGDGRALWLGEAASRMGPQEVQLKGAGRTVLGAAASAGGAFLLHLAFGSGRDAQSMAFFRAAEMELLYSGDAISRPS